MTGYTDYFARKSLNAATGQDGVVPTWVALFTAVGVDAGTGFTEVTGGSYARVSTSTSTWNAASGSAPSTISNTLAITFPTASASWGTIIGWGLFDASSGGNLIAWDYLGNFQWLPCTVSSASPGVITSPAHGYSVADTVIYSTEYGGTAPSFSASNFTGQLIVAHAATDTFDVTNSAIPVNTSSTGDGAVRKIVPTLVGSGATPSFSSGTFTLECT